MSDITSLEVSTRCCSICDFLETGKDNVFMIPEYQRPYSWEQEQVETLINDILNFTENRKRKNANYFLGSVVSFINKNKNKIIDGQQRITTLFLLLRAIYEKLGDAESNKNKNNSNICCNLKTRIGGLIFKTNKLTNKIYIKKPLLTSKAVASDANEVLLRILSNGSADPKSKDRYSRNYCFIQETLKKKFENNLRLFFDFVLNVLDNTIVLPITANSFDTALIIFQTLNDRGMPLTDADIFKATIYQNTSISNQNNFISEWMQLSDDAENNQETIQKLFYYYMFYLRAIEKDIDSTTPGLRKYYLDKKANRLLNENLMSDLKQSLNLWRVVNSNQILEDEKWSQSLNILTTLDILRSYPNEFWKYPVITFYLKYRKARDFATKFEIFLKKFTAVLIKQYLHSPSVNSVKGAILKLNKEIIDSSSPLFNGFSDVPWEDESIYMPHPKIERMLLKLLAYASKSKTLLPNTWEIEHIFPKKWDDHFYSNEYTNEKIKEQIEHIGNKLPLEKQLNIKASNGYFSKKISEYQKSKIQISRNFGNLRSKLGNKDWTLEDITRRDKEVNDKLQKLLKRWCACNKV